VVVAFFARAYLARIIFARSSKEIAVIFGVLCFAIFFRIIYTIISRYFYAYKDTKTPLYVSLFIIILNIFLAYFLSKPQAFGVVGLAIAQGIVAFVEVFILTVIITKRDPKLFSGPFLNYLGRSLIATIFAAIGTYFVMQFLPLQLADLGFVLVVKLSIISLVTFSIFIIVAKVLRLPEADIILRRLKDIILKPVKI
jgi:putative peptidoglycan lipid II flippase